MTHCTAIIAALPREVKALVKGWQRHDLPGNIVVYTDGRAIVACAGMGAARVALAVEAAMTAMPVTRLISAGLAGACNPRLHAGDILRAGVVIDGATGEQFSDSQFQQVLVSTDSIASVHEKTRLRAEFLADAVDMEAATVARIAHQHGFEFRAIKAISDEASFEIAALSQFATTQGQFRERAFAMHAALRPAMWSKVIALGRNSSIALVSLTEALRSELD